MKDLKQMMTKRNEVFGDMSPKISINLTIDMPDLHKKAVENNTNRADKLKAALNSTNKSMVENLMTKMRENPIYVKSGSDHVGGGA